MEESRAESWRQGQSSDGLLCQPAERAVADPPKLVMMATRQLRLPSDLLDIASPSHRPHSPSLTHSSYHHRRSRCYSSEYTPDYRESSLETAEAPTTT